MLKAVIGIILVGALVSSAWAVVGGGDIVFKEKKTGNVVFSHESHAGMNLQCTACHDGLYTTKEKHKKATMAQMRKGQSCGACHDGKKAFSVAGNCNTCHKK